MLSWDRRLHIVARVLLIFSGFTSSLVVPGSINLTADVPPTLECHGWPELQCGLASEVAISPKVVGPEVTPAPTIDAVGGSFTEPLAVHRQNVAANGQNVRRSFSWGGFMPMQPMLPVQPVIPVSVAPVPTMQPPSVLGELDEVDVAPPLVPIQMSPNGNYGQNSASELAYMGLLKPGIVNEVRDGAVLFDLGCADGMNTLSLLQEIKQKTTNFTMTFVDLPGNDWTTTRKVLNSAIPKIYPDDVPVAARFQPEVTGGAQSQTQVGFLLAKSFYERLAPESSVDVAFSGTSVHYLSDGGVSEGTETHASQDWLRFLRARAYELKEGGTLHVSASHTPFKGQNIGPIWNLVKRVLHESVQMGLVTHAQRERWCWPGYARTKEEFFEPFSTGRVPKLSLEKFEVVLVESPYWSMAAGDPATFVESYVPSVIAWIGPYLAKTLPRTVLDLLEVKLYSEVMQMPEVWRHDYNQALIKIRKRPGTDDPGW